jgi:hypothetical protein
MIELQNYIDVVAFAYLGGYSSYVLGFTFEVDSRYLWHLTTVGSVIGFTVATYFIVF